MVTTHYERRDDGFYVTWGADFANDEPGERRLYDGGDLRHLMGLDEKTQQEYMDLRTRAENGIGTNEMGRCKRCDEHASPLEVTRQPHVCAELGEDAGH